MNNKENEDKWQQRRKGMYSSGPPPQSWPANVKPISQEGLDFLGLKETKNGECNLYWDGKQIEVRKILGLSPFQKLGVCLTVLAAVAGAISSGLTTYYTHETLEISRTEAKTQIDLPPSF